MIRRHANALRALLMGADLLVAVTVFITVYVLTYARPAGEVDPLPGMPWVTIALYALTWVLLLYSIGEYRLRARWTLRGEVGGIVHATFVFASIGLAVVILSGLSGTHRVFLVALFVIQGLATIVTRVGLRITFIYLRKQGRNTRYLLILGTDLRARDFASHVVEQTAFGLNVAGFMGDPPDEPDPSWTYLGPLSSTVDVIHHGVIDEVAICLPSGEWDQVDEIVRVCQEEGRIVRIPLAIPQFGAGLRIVEDLDGVAVMSLLQGPQHMLALAMKRCVDLAGALLLLILLSPLLLAVAAYIRFRDGGPVLFRQTRIGMHGRPFTILKYRTMVTDAEDRLHELTDHSDTRGPAFKMASDPRVTSWGRLLRRASIDELPQLWNVVRGDMSLVGPRPAPSREVQGYDIWHRRRLSMKPGMTGLWQISSRIDEDFDERARLDLDYIDRWSFWLDIRIVAMTVPTVLHMNGH